ncbi:MAG: hypothetical protein M1817_000644 [Caeruleum heppii]|nr:MAG: hypothetical protein M1817_000644 [Caeruleum heppii]
MHTPVDNEQHIINTERFRWLSLLRRSRPSGPHSPLLEAGPFSIPLVDMPTQPTAAYDPHYSGGLPRRTMRPSRLPRLPLPAITFRQRAARLGSDGDPRVGRARARVAHEAAQWRRDNPERIDIVEEELRLNGGVYDRNVRFLVDVRRYGLL